jgi:hypothetical protein
MSGNVWQMVLNRYDPATRRWIYRLTKPDFKGQSVMGGSWARGPAYLRCGYGVGMQAGLRHPDLGFRPVREPKGEDWRVQPRRLSAIPSGNGEILVSWGLLKNTMRRVLGSTFIEQGIEIMRDNVFQRNRLPTAPVSSTQAGNLVAATSITFVP